MNWRREVTFPQLLVVVILEVTVLALVLPL